MKPADRPECQRCGLYHDCSRPMIPGRGSEQAAIMFIGDSPGRDEDMEGKCFVGMPGYLLDLALQGYEIPEGAVYRTNVVRCRPPQNKLLKEKLRIECCSPMLLDEIERIRPRILVPMGAVATGALIGNAKISSMHGRVLEQDGFLILPMYNPAAILRNPVLQTVFDRDFAVLRKILVYGKVAPDPIDDGLIVDFGEALATIRACRDRKYVAFDYESNFLYPWEHEDPRIGLISLSLGTHKARALAFDSWKSPWESPWSADERRSLIEAMRGLLQDDSVDKVAHNAKYETMATEVAWGFRPGLIRDTMLSHTLVDENVPHDLDDIAWRWTDLGGYKDDFKTLLPDKNNYLSAPLDKLGWYGCRDAVVTERVDPLLLAKLSSEQRAVLRMQEELIPVLAQVELRGKAVDEAEVHRLDREYTAVADEIEATMRAWPEVARVESLLAWQRAQKDAEKAADEILDREARETQTKANQGAIERRRRLIQEIEVQYHDRLQGYCRPFNFRSDPQIQVLMLDKQGFGFTPTRFLTESGLPSVGKDSLVVWGREDERARVYRRYRRIRHSHSQFIVPMFGTPEAPGFVTLAKDRRIHAQYNQHIARTGRLSSSRPNEQNRVRDDTCKVLGISPLQTAMYCSRYPDGELVKGDYSQLELRILASASRDARLIEAYERGWDLHAVTTLRFFHGLPDGADDTIYQACLKVAAEGTLWKVERSIGKRCNFLTGYGGSGQRLQALLAEQGIYLSEQECDRYIELFFEVYPGVRTYMRGVAAAGRKNAGDVLAGDGRVRHLPALIFGSPGDMAEAERQAGNHTIQWPAAKLTMLALIRLEVALPAAGLKTICIGSVHDSVILDSPAGEAEQAKKILKREMEGAAFDSRWMPRGWMHPSIPILADID